MDSPLLSIIIPVYNAEQYLPLCLDSIFGASVDPELYEVITIDDCSSDHSYEILQQYAQRHPNLRCSRHEVNLQLGETRNDGIRQARGEYVWFVDSDDKVKTENLPKLFRILESRQLDLIAFNYTRFCDTGEYRMDRYHLTASPVLSGMDLYTHSHSFPAPWNKIYRRSMLTDNKLFFVPKRLPEDQGWLTECYLHARKAQSFDIELYCWHVTPGSVSNDLRRVGQYINGFTALIEEQTAMMTTYSAPLFWTHNMFYLFTGYNARIWQAVSEGLISDMEYEQRLRWEKERVDAVLKLLPFSFCREYLCMCLLRVCPGLFIKTRNLVRRFRP